MNFILEYWIQFLFGLMISLGTYLFHKVKKEYQTLELMKQSICNLIYTRLVDICRETNDKDEIDLYDKERFNLLYQEYQKLDCSKQTDAQDLKKQIDEKNIQ